MSFQKVPTVILNHIGQYLTNHEKKAASILNKKFRNVFLPMVLKVFFFVNIPIYYEPSEETISFFMNEGSGVKIAIVSENVTKVTEYKGRYIAILEDENAIAVSNWIQFESHGDKFVLFYFEKKIFKQPENTYYN